MIFIYKNRGILVPVYTFLPILFVAVAKSVLQEYLNLDLSKFNASLIIAIGLLIAPIWIYLTKTDTIKLDDGSVKPIYIEHHFFYLNLNIWNYIVFFCCILAFISGIFDFYNLI